MVVEVPRETLRRLEVAGFLYDVNGRDILCFLIEQGLAVLEKHRSTTIAAEGSLGRQGSKPKAETKAIRSREPDADRRVAIKPIRRHKMKRQCPLMHRGLVGMAGNMTGKLKNASR